MEKQNKIERVESAIESGCSYVLGSFFKVFEEVNDYVKDKTGKSISDRMAEQREKEEEERQNHWGRWAFKKLLKGTIGGMFGAYNPLTKK